MRHKPTFKPSPAKRPWYRRLTPVAWALIGVGVVVVALSIVAAAMVLGGRPSEEPWSPTPTATVPPTPTEVQPTPTPTVWYEGMVSPTPEPTPAYPAWWTDQMTQDENGHWWPPEEVAEMVREHFRECDSILYTRYLIESKPPDLDGYEQEVIPYCTVGERQALAQDYIRNIRQGINVIVWGEWEHGCFYQVQEWSEDGLECTLGQTCSNGTVYEYDHTGELLSSE
ncbi:MAG TPA: hypothetical protein EYP77_03110, partial [Anaerolineae bacterium]|nr:hypothetical protein [Anaerolineae bacterium]